MANCRSKYAPSLIQEDDSCYLCGRRDRKLDRHEIFPGPFRDKSKKYGLWVLVCNEDCHEGKYGAQYNRAVRKRLSQIAQRRAMEVYGWSTADFIREFGKNWL